MTEPNPSPSRRLPAVDTHPVSCFVLLALAISWAIWLPTFLFVSAETSAVMIPGAFGPALAAAAMVRLRGDSVRGWLADGLNWRVDGRWYAAAVAIPLGVGVAFATVLSLRTGSFDAANVAEVGALYPVTVVALALVGGGQEEFGWRGYALPLLQQRWSALTASAVVGVVWAVWHLPAFAFGVPGYTGSFALYTLLLVGLSVVFTWLFESTAGSVLVAMLFHGGVNAASGLGALFGADPSTAAVSPYAVLVPLVWVVALALLARHGHETLSEGPAVADHGPEDASQATEVSA